MEKNYPKHIGLILDGNRRWAKERGKMPWDGHREGLKKVREIKNWMIDLNIKEMTLYCFSMQNFKRDIKEVYFLMKVFEKAFTDIVKDKDIFTKKVKIKHIGRIELLPKKLQKLIRNAEEKTKNHDQYQVNFALAYGGQEEIVDASKRIAEDAIKNKLKNIDIEKFKKYLWLADEPDIIIRTSGEQRTSNFLCFQQAYSEWFFPRVKWPDFSKSDLANIIDDYLDRHRRFGK